ncbi:cysteine synthase A [Candidatus Avelusimicrobium faecicola]|uniref:cysteine synthase A n=1 Tax=Candidatus Avelusimicrobium faecicola TaxID=3416205 RepID=UPI003D12DDAE
MALVNNLEELIGNTPLLRLNRLHNGPAAVYAKLEMFNPYSIKDRPAAAMLQAAEQAGQLKPGGALVEPTSGNTGIALAFLAAAKGYTITLTMPASMSPERIKILKALGANVVLTDPALGMNGAIQEAENICRQTGAFMPSQFTNPNNPTAHRQTAQEIDKDLHGKVDILVCGVGTGGTLTGTGRALKQMHPHLRIVAVEPSDSPVLSGGKAGPHKLQGIGAGFIPSILDTRLIDEVVQVTAENAGKTARELAKKEGLLAGISGGAALWAALQEARKPQNAAKNIVVILPDSGERYLSTWEFDENA